MLDLAMPEADSRIDTCRRNIRIAVALRGRNMSETARDAGMSRNAVTQFVAGRTSLTYANMLRVCDVLDIPIGLLHKPDAITEQRIRLHKLLERLPEHLTGPALEAAAEAAAAQKRQ